VTAFDGADTPASPAAQCRRRLQPGGAIMRRQRVNARLAHGRTDDHRIRLRCINSQQDKRVSAQRKLKHRHVVYGNDILQLQSVSENTGTALLTAKRNIPLRYFVVMEVRAVRAVYTTQISVVGFYQLYWVFRHGGVMVKPTAFIGEIQRFYLWQNQRLR